MSYIPQAMSGREIQHDIKFSNDGAISGIVSGIQNITLAGQSLLLLGGSAGSNEFVMSSDFIAIDPGGAARDLYLPAALGDLTLVGRTLKIFNSSDNAIVPGENEVKSELITLRDFAGNFVAYVGVGAIVEFTVSSHDASTGALEVVMHTQEFKHIVKLEDESHAGDQELLAKCTNRTQAGSSTDANKTIFLKYVLFKRIPTSGALLLNTALIKSGGVTVITTDSDVQPAHDVAQSCYLETGTNPTSEIAANNAIAYNKGSTASAAIGLIVELIFGVA
jgi:hypothetical protein